ncbi:MAG: hypothetical protein AAGJ18_03480 [Bacteroidota bacterium]
MDTNFLWGHLLSSGFFLIVGLHYWQQPPKKYDVPEAFNMPSKMAQLNEDTWNTSFQYFGKITSISSTIFLLIGLLFSYLVATDKYPSTKIYGLNFALAFIAMMTIGITAYAMTETYLAKTFDKNGNRRNFTHR